MGGISPASVTEGEMGKLSTNIDRLLKARAEIDEALRQHKTSLTVLFTDVVASTAYFERYGDTAGLSLLRRHADLAGEVVGEFQGQVVKTIGDSVLADFREPLQAVLAAAEIQRRQQRLNLLLSQRERFNVRIGIHSGMLFRSGDDLFGDVVNLAARITKRTGPAQILLSRTVYEAIGADPNLPCRWAGKVTVEGKADPEDIYEVIWTDAATYAEIREKATMALARGEVPSQGAQGAGVEEVFVPAKPPPSSLLERYNILAEIGRGGMGVVYKAQEQETGEVVALKVLKPEIAADVAVMERFKNEVRLARRITHKNVCRIHEFQRAEETAYLSMEFVEGESLRQVLIRFGSLSLRSGTRMVEQICAGLREAHAQGIVHRDLKPENVMVDRAGNVKLMDFGIARWVQAAGASGQTGSLVGTPSYMAPEQAEGKPVDHRADIYALGLILYEIFSGCPAFRGDAPIEIALKQVRETPVPPRALEPTISVSLEKTILKSLEKDPGRRFQSVDELLGALRQVGPLAPASASSLARAPAKRVAWLPERQHRGRLLVETSILAVLAVVLIADRGWQQLFASKAFTQAPAQTEAEPPPASRQPPLQIETQQEAPVLPVRTTSDPHAGSYLRVGSFDKEAEAEEQARQLQGLGYPVVVVPKRSIWRFWRRSYDVQVGPYRNPEMVQKAQQSLENSGFAGTGLVRSD